MTPLGLPLDRLPGLPRELLAALRLVPSIARHTEAMERHTSTLQDVLAALERVAGDTAALPALRSDMGRVAQTTSVLEPMDGRMAAIEGAMPVLVEVQQHLARVPDTLAGLDESMTRLSGLLERMLGSLDGLSGSVDVLQESVGPLGRVARRLPGQRSD